MSTPIEVTQDPADSSRLDVSFTLAFDHVEFNIHKADALRLARLLRAAALADGPRPIAFGEGMTEAGTRMLAAQALQLPEDSA